MLHARQEGSACVSGQGLDADGLKRTRGEHSGSILIEKDSFQVVDCSSCGFKHVLPLPSEEELERVYAHDYYATEKPTYLRRADEDKSWWERLYNERLECVEELLSSDAQRILDVGSGPGFLLECAQRRGWSVLGIEPSHQAADHARNLGVSVVEAFLTDELVVELQQEDSFDCIHAAEVLEHLPDPRSMVQRMRSLLRPGGILVLSVPNDFNPVQVALTKARGFSPWWVAPPHHLNYFDFDSLEGLLASEGFEALHRETSFPIDLFLLMGDNYTVDDEMGRACHRKRMELESALRDAGRGDLLRGMYDAFASLGLGRHAVVFARRTS